MDDMDFIGRAAGLLALCTEGQRTQLARMIETYGAPAEGAASDRARTGAPATLASDAGLAGKSIDQAFPGLRRLRGHVDQTFAEMLPDSKRFGV